MSHIINNYIWANLNFQKIMLYCFNNQFLKFFVQQLVRGNSWQYDSDGLFCYSRILRILSTHQLLAIISHLGGKHFYFLCWNNWVSKEVWQNWRACSDHIGFLIFFFFPKLLWFWYHENIIIFFWSSFWNFTPLSCIVRKKTSKPCLVYYKRLNTAIRPLLL